MIRAMFAKLSGLRAGKAASDGKSEQGEGQVAAEGSFVDRALSKRSVECMTFRDKALRRGLHAVNVLTGFGSLLSSSHGSEDTYGLSTPVQKLDVFISHSWSMARLPKFLALALYFNLGTATIAGLGACFIAAYLGFEKLIPVYKCEDSAKGHCHAPTCVVAFYLFFVIVLLFGHDFVRRLGSFHNLSRVAFLDKACIHQTDKVLQKEGIASLSAFLTCSNELLVVYTNLYLKRLWTVYELASTLVLRPDSRITMLPVDLVWLVYVGSFVMFGLNVSQSLFLSDAVATWVKPFVKLKVCSAFVYICSMVMGLPLMIFFRRWARQCSQMYATARGFSIRSAACAFEEDRVAVYANVASLMRDFDFVSKEAKEDVALDAFDLLARELMPLHLRASLGNAGMPYTYSLTILMTTVAYGLDIGVAENWHLMPTKKIVNCFINWEGILFATLPLWIAACSWVSSKQLNLKGIREVVFLLSSWVLVQTGMIWFTMSFEKLYMAAKTSWLMFALYGIVTASLNVAAYFVYHRQHIPPEAYATVKQHCRELCASRVLPLEAPAPSKLAEAIVAQAPRASEEQLPVTVVSL